MIAAWMIYSIAIGALLAVAASALERALGARRWPLRWMWVGALVAMVALPAGAVLASKWEHAHPPVALGAPSVQRGDLASLAGLPAFGAPVVIAPRSRLSALDRAFVVGWAMVSAAVLLALAGSVVATRRRRRCWQTTSADGFRVLIARDIGPGVIGFWAPTIVLPEWVLELPLARRRLILRHELEHVAAGDPRLVLLAAIGVVVFPWNLALWYGVRRLRLAAEIDCDARVLRSGADVRSYGTLLLDIGERVSKHPAAMVAAFSEPMSSLERRLRVMSMRTPRRLALHTATFASLAALVIVLACETPRPLAPHPAEGLAARDVKPSGSPVRVGASARRAPNPALLAAMRQYYPDILRGESKDSVVWFVARHDGAIVATNRGKFDEASVRAKFPPFTTESIESIEIAKNHDGVFGPNPVGAIWITVTADGSAVPIGSAPPSSDARRAAMLAAVRTIIQQRHPAVLQAAAGSDVVVWIISNAHGDVVNSAVPTSSSERAAVANEYPADAIKSVDVGKAQPGELGAARVSYIWIQLKS